jgi:heme exporter protein B
MMSQVLTLLKKELLLEWRQKHTFWSALLYIGCTVFVIYIMAKQPEENVWNALFWISQLFITVNTVSKSFLQESVDRNRYYYVLIPPSSFIISKLLYSSLLMLFMSLVTLGIFYSMMEIDMVSGLKFVLVTVIGAQGLALLFTFLSAIAAQAKQNAALMAVLGFPISIPLLLILEKLSIATLSPIVQEGWGLLVGVMLLMNAIIVSLALILFPFLWKE